MIDERERLYRLLESGAITERDYRRDLRELEKAERATRIAAAAVEAAKQRGPQ